MNVGWQRWVGGGLGVVSVVLAPLFLIGALLLGSFMLDAPQSEMEPVAMAILVLPVLTGGIGVLVVVRAVRPRASESTDVVAIAVTGVVAVVLAILGMGLVVGLGADGLLVLGRLAAMVFGPPVAGVWLTSRPVLRAPR